MRRLATAPLLALFTLAAGCQREPAGTAPARSAAPSGPVAPDAAPPPHDGAAAQDWGEPDMPKVQKLFRSRFAEVKRCYEAELQRHPQARGKLTLRFTIVESGALSGVSVARSTFERRDVPSCVAEVVRRWRTPFRPAEPVEVEYPFSFSPR
ncbi:MAG TPA: AgmX/PglI C-terminal domain-containing protein [Anaeromyxobacter sp.]|nr:AgmX/PglI C-terminal domain-containing protein [Anaeromyxobacter sp.]